MPSPHDKTPKKRFRFNWITFDFMLAGSIGMASTAACLLLAIPLALTLSAIPIAGIIIGAAVLGAIFGFGLKQYLMRTKKNTPKPKDYVELKDVAESATEIYTQLKVNPGVTLADQPAPPSSTPPRQTPSPILKNGSMLKVSRSDAELVREAAYQRSHAPSRRDDFY